ncbi:lysyl-tRNA synthetase [Janibacter sp. FSL W8-0316]|uniref:lysyl-tRNA synthetase n=1 Tax=Janibacter sp. FSL W8-0316 TaxID=2975325 RepID=UPI0030FC69B6
MEFITEYWPYAAALLPTVGVAFLFYWIIRYMMEADRRERKALADWKAEHQKNDGESTNSSSEMDSSPHG